MQSTYLVSFGCREMLLQEDVTSACVVLSSLTFTGTARVTARKDNKNLKKDMIQVQRSVNGMVTLDNGFNCIPV